MLHDFQGAESPSCSSSDSDSSSVSSRSLRERRLSQQQRNLQAVRRRDYVRRLAARRVEVARRVLRARFVTGVDMRYGQLVERENVQLVATNTLLKDKVREMQDRLEAIRALLANRTVTATAS